MNRSMRRFAAWTAIVGVALSALWPLASQARPASERVPMLICGPGGLQTVHVDQAPTNPKSQDHREHCALCLGGIEPVAQARPTDVVLELTATREQRAATGVEVPQPILLLHPPSQAPPDAPAA